MKSQPGEAQLAAAKSGEESLKLKKAAMAKKPAEAISLASSFGC
jgi:hypothetical protein